MPNRIEKVNSLLEHEISKVLLRGFNFPDAMITLTHVEATANLIDAKAYISVMFTRQSFPVRRSISEGGSDGGPEEKTDVIIKVLNKNIHSIQQEINRMLNMRPIPKIRFVKDEKIAEAAKIEGLLERLKKEEK